MYKLFSGTSNPSLSQEVAELLKHPLSESEVVRFDNSEVRVKINEDVKNDTSIVIQTGANPTDSSYMELFLFCDALRRSEAKKVVAFIPYLGYARQNIQHRDGECVSIHVIINFLETIGFSKIYTFDMHDEGTGGVFSIPFKNMTAFPLMATKLKEYLGDRCSIDSVAIASPDQGGIERAREFGKCLFNTDEFDLTVVEKHRDQEHKHMSEALGLYGNVKGKTVILVDDMITSGGTLMHAAELALERGAKAVIAAIVHHDFSATAPKKLQDSKLEAIISTNSIALKPEQNIEKLKEVSIAPIIAAEIATTFQK